VNCDLYLPVATHQNFVLCCRPHLSPGVPRGVTRGHGCMSPVTVGQFLSPRLGWCSLAFPYSAPGPPGDFRPWFVPLSKFLATPLAVPIHISCSRFIFQVFLGRPRPLGGVPCIAWLAMMSLLLLNMRPCQWMNVRASKRAWSGQNLITVSYARNGRLDKPRCSLRRDDDAVSSCICSDIVLHAATRACAGGVWSMRFLECRS